MNSKWGKENRFLAKLEMLNFLTKSQILEKFAKAKGDVEKSQSPRVEE